MGYYVKIELNSGEYVVYMHLHPEIEPWVAVGADVYPGQVLGKVGDTGNASGCHLHLTVQNALTLPPNPTDPLEGTFDPKLVLGNC